MPMEVKENISSFIDDELDASDREKIISHLKSDVEKQQVFSRYSVISEALKKNLPDNPSHNLFERVQNAMQHEPELLAPAPANVAKDLETAEIVELPTKEAANGSVKPALSFGIAATVALVSYLGFQSFQSTSELPVQPVVATTTTAPAATTQELHIPAVTAEEIGVASVTSGEQGNDGIYAEQSILDDGQWTRITQIGSISLEGDVLMGNPEANVGLDLQNDSLSPFARPVNLENSSAK